MNPLHPTVPVTIDGHEYQLRYEYRDYAKAEGRLKMSLVGPQSIEFWSSEAYAYKTAVLLYVGLLNCERQLLARLYPQGARPVALTFDDAAGLISFENTQMIEQAVAEALDKFMPKSKEPEAAATDAPLAQTPETATTGTNSTPSLVPPSA